MVDVRKVRVGVTAGHAGQGPKPVDAYRLDAGDGLAIEVWTYGATLVEVLVPDRTGRVGNVVLRHDELGDYERPRRANPYFGATVGRFCRNIGHAAFTIDGVTHRLDRNDRRHHVHGGGLGFDRVVWDAEVLTGPGAAELRLRHVSPDGDQGYPGRLTAETTYRVERGGRLSFEHRATTTASTVVGLTNHAYWNLAGDGVVDAHRMRLNARRMLTFDAEYLPVAGPTPVAGTGFDFTAARPLADAAIDNFFILAGPEWAAELADPVSGRGMRVVTDQSGLGLYTLDRFARRRGGVCLEAGPWPDAPNRPDFPSARVDPGTGYLSRTTHQFTLC